MGDSIGEHAPAGRKCQKVPLNLRVRVFIAIAMLTGLVLLAGCGETAAGSALRTPPPTPTPLPTATATATATPTHSPTATSPCQPDPDGIYAEQAGYVTTLTDAPLPAPPKTKHGIGSGGDDGGVLQGGESGLCTIGTFASITAFLTQHLQSLGWQYSKPPTALSACFHYPVPDQAWWKGSDTFAWYDGGDAGHGSIFWSYTYCSVHG